jgi:hypothetical protein
MQITQKLVNELFNYIDGKIYWKKKTSPYSNDVIGKESGYIDKGYKLVKINNYPYSVHNIIFLIHRGYLPEIVDHIDENTLNNRIDNLRPASKSQNNWNAKKRKDNSSGIKGVSLFKGKWTARCQVNEVQHFLGNFIDISEAEQAVKMFRQNNHNEYTNHG